LLGKINHTEPQGIGLQHFCGPSQVQDALPGLEEMLIENGHFSPAPLIKAKLREAIFDLLP
jgi:hypothetical protein